MAYRTVVITAHYGVFNKLKWCLDHGVKPFHRLNAMFGIVSRVTHDYT